MPRFNHPPKKNSYALVGQKRIAEYFGRSVDTIQRWIKYQNFPGCKLPDNSWIVLPEQIDEWIKVRKQHTKVRTNGKL